MIFPRIGFIFITIRTAEKTLYIKKIILQGLCPGLSHGQKYGISYVASHSTTPRDEPVDQRVGDVVQSHSVVLLSDSSAISTPVNLQNNTEPSSKGDSETFRE